MQCLKPDGEMAPCGPGNDQCGPALTGGPQYHVVDSSCGMNDPNGPFYDATHGVYHIFYQDHLWAPMPDSVPTGREGPVWGHAVSHDMVHWAHVPVGLWNGDGWYDMHGIFTGSATIDETGPVLVFPGVCDLYPPGSAGAAVPGCRYGYAFGTARPMDASDPLLRNWSKSAHNPIANDTFDDPSTAWRTSDGEWRLIGHCGDGSVGDCGPAAPGFRAAPEWASRDFETWRRVGFTNLPAGECASLYPLPPLVEGAAPPPARRDGGAALPTHVHKWGCGWVQDCYALGAWEENDATAPGVWTTAPSSPAGARLERGISYAAKDFWDAAHARRISWAWAPLDTADSLTLPREVRYDPRLARLVFRPLAEQARLRNATLARLGGAAALRRAAPRRLAATAQAEAQLVVRLPPAQPVEATAGAPLHLLSVKVTAPSAAADGTADAAAAAPLLHFHVEYDPAAASANVTATSSRGPQRAIDTVPLLPGEGNLTLRLFLDHTIAEAYWHERVAITLPFAPPAGAPLEIEVSGDGLLASAHVWSVASIWVTPEELAANATCARYGQSDAALLAARDAIPLSSPYTASEGAPAVFLPVFSSHAAAPRRAAVWIHGLSGDANSYFCSGVAAVRAAGAAGATISLAPWFGDEQLTIEAWLGAARAQAWRRRHGVGGAAPAVSAYWASARWLSGGDNSPEPARFTTAFDALDAAARWLRARHAALERTSVVGFSAGAQLAARWAFFSPEAAPGTNVTTVVSDPSSFLYLDGARPAAACRPLRDTGARHACASFAVPEEEEDCPAYDEYKYGLAGLANVSSHLSLAAFARNATRLARAVAGYAYRDVRYLLGTRDACNCNTAGFNNSDAVCYPAAGDGCSPNAHGGALEGRGCCDTFPDSSTDNALDVRCEALLQGSNRLQRGLNYLSYLRARAPGAALVAASFPGGHNNSGAFFSEALAEWAFAPAEVHAVM